MGVIMQGIFINVTVATDVVEAGLDTDVKTLFDRLDFVAGNMEEAFDCIRDASKYFEDSYETYGIGGGKYLSVKSRVVEATIHELGNKCGDSAG